MSIATRRYAAWRRALLSIPLLASLALLPGTARADEPTQHVELPEIGLAADFPAGWQARTPLQPRESWFERASLYGRDGGSVTSMSTSTPTRRSSSMRSPTSGSWNRPSAACPWS